MDPLQSIIKNFPEQKRIIMLDLSEQQHSITLNDQNALVQQLQFLKESYYSLFKLYKLSNFKQIKQSYSNFLSHLPQQTLYLHPKNKETLSLILPHILYLIPYLLKLKIKAPQNLENLAPLYNLFSLKNLSHLTLNLSFQPITMQYGCKILQNSIKQLVNLKLLNLNIAGNLIGNQNLQVLSYGLKNFINLQNLTLNLHYNAIGPEGVQFLGQIIGNLQELKTLAIDFSQNDLQQLGVQYLLFKGVQKLLKLEELNLNLSFNNLDILGAKNLGEALKKLIQLKKLNLDLSNNSIKWEGMMHLGQKIRHLSNLEELQLSLKSNQIGEYQDEGTKHLGESLLYLKNLRNLILFLNDNRIGEEGIVYLGCGLLRLPKLECLSLYLYFNNLGDVGTQQVVEIVKNLRNCKKFSIILNHNFIMEEGRQLLEDLNQYLVKKIPIENLYLQY